MINKRKIENAVNSDRDNLEEAINEKLKLILFQIGEDNQEALIYAREIFFKG